MTNEPFLTYLYLYAAHTKKKVASLVKNKCISEESALLGRQLGEAVEKCTEHGGDVIVSQFILERLDGAEKTLIDH